MCNRVTCPGPGHPIVKWGGAKAPPARGEAPAELQWGIFSLTTCMSGLGPRCSNLSCPLPSQLSRARQESRKTKLSASGSLAYVFLAGLALVFLERVLSTSWKRKNCAHAYGWGELLGAIVVEMEFLLDSPQCERKPIRSRVSSWCLWISEAPGNSIRCRMHEEI